MSKNYTDTSEDKKNDGKIAPFQTPVFYKPLFRVSTTVPVVPFSRLNTTKSAVLWNDSIAFEKFFIDETTICTQLISTTLRRTT